MPFYTIFNPLGSEISTGEIAALAVTAAKIATDAVETAKIKNLNVTEGKLADDAVSLAKLKAGTDGELITWDASGNPAAVAVGTAAQVLTSNGVGAAPTFQAAASGGAEISGGNYTGNDADNRAIAHGLSGTPNFVWVFGLHATVGQYFSFGKGSTAYSYNTAGQATTAIDATNFYVGTWTAVNSNNNPIVYHWLAIKF